MRFVLILGLFLSILLPVQSFGKQRADDAWFAVWAVPTVTAENESARPAWSSPADFKYLTRDREPQRQMPDYPCQPTFELPAPIGACTSITGRPEHW